MDECLFYCNCIHGWKNLSFNLVHNGLQSQEIGCLDLKGILVGFYLSKQKSMYIYCRLGSMYIGTHAFRLSALTHCN